MASRPSFPASGRRRARSPANRRQLALGLNYWLFESAPLKLTYEINSGAVDENRFFLQFAYGF